MYQQYNNLSFNCVFVGDCTVTWRGAVSYMEGAVSSYMEGAASSALIWVNLSGYTLGRDPSDPVLLSLKNQSVY
jgi:hypothetical protein